MPRPILVVDDDPDIRQILQDRLEAYGYLVAKAGDGQAALDLVERLTPQGLFLDIRMPGLDGLEVLSRIRNRHPSIPIVIVTAASTGGDLAAALHAGAQAYLLKPFDTTHIKQAAAHWFGAPHRDAKTG